MEELKIEPNFYISLPYLVLSNTYCYTDKGWLWIEDEEWCLFPPLPHLNNYTPNAGDYPQKNVWSDFYNYHPLTPQMGFLDWEYLYDSHRFNHMEGGPWEAFRKNSRKWSRKNEYWSYTSVCSSTAECALLVGKWLENKIEVAQDAELIVKCALEPVGGIRKKYLYNNNGKLVAMNVWDENYKYINYRLCIVSPHEDFLDEFTRLLFYTDAEIQVTGKFINDGGTLGNAGLEFFKNKLNPLRKREVHSWIIK
jgi:hypothetical protein